MKALWLIAIVLLATTTTLGQQISGDVLGSHNLGPGGTSPVRGGLSAPCLYCHAPHSGVGGNTPLWNQTLTTQTYTTYQSTTYHEAGTPRPVLGSDSNLCLSCHDGSVAPGQTVAYGKFAMAGAMKSPDNFGSDLSSSHPFSLVLPFKDSPDLIASLYSQGVTADPTRSVKLVKGNIECTTCHNAHVEATDLVVGNFLVRDGSSGQLCLACHEPGNRTVNGQTNYLGGWTNSVHATAANKTANQSTVNLGGYATVALNACESCHETHNAPGAARLLRGKNEADCAACHGGGSNISPVALNVSAEFAKVGHPFSTASSSHDANENILLNQNRHATCVDCHNPHSANQVTAFLPPPAMRPSQSGVEGISATDGITVLNPATNQYENCLRCHGSSTGKTTLPATFGYLPVWAAASGDPLNVIPQFALLATSSHPVMHDRTSPFSQPSLRSFMVNEDGVTPGRAMGTRIFCTDCHNSDDNREFGGTGPNGPHGSRWTHILERRYEFSQAPGPGQMITNLFPTPDLSVNGPYALCGKCHDLSKVAANTSFSEHARHINDGFSCSACHTAHGMGGASGSISGERLVNFDINVVAPSGATPISYSRATNSCGLTCHNHPHSQIGSASVRIKK
ncbi:MAG TPA: cytochrome c3 family protein [Candidatus Angelobacter sp.]|nr:cytochrome c3 family protein [Candidatus Angelobacter sp.]